jgi:hypothetical protein
MSQEAPLSLRDPWVVRSVAVVAAILGASVILGFMVFPLVQPTAQASSLWDAICSAAGVVRAPTSEKPIEPQFIVSPAVLTSDMLSGADGGVDRPRGHARPSMRDLSRTHGRQSRRFSQPRGSVPQRHL